MGIKVVSKVASLTILSMLSLTSADARIINGVALLVNGNPITMYEIEKVVHTFKVDRQKAIEVLVDKNIEQEAIKNFGLSVDDKEIEDYIFRNAMAAKMNVFDFEKMLTSKGLDINEYKKDLSEKIKKDKLIRSIIDQNYKEPTDSDLKEYYNSNIGLYNLPTQIKVSRYDSQDADNLEKFIKTPLILREGISMESQTLNQPDLNPDFWSMLSAIPEKAFSQILPNNGGYSTFYVAQKIDIKKTSFGDAKNIVRARYLKDQENRAIEDFYKKRRASADIVVVGEDKK